MCLCDEEYHKVVKKETFSCDSNCRSYVFYQRLLCEHTLAVAEEKGVLADFITKINTRRQSSNVSLVNSFLHRQCVTSASGKKKGPQRRGANNVVGQNVEKSVKSPVITHQPVTVARKIGLIAKCYGCKEVFRDAMNKVPKDLVFKKLDFREWCDRTTGERRRSKTLVPTYYHLKMDCIRRNYPNTEIEDILVYKEVADSLEESHIAKLRDFGITW